MTDEPTRTKKKGLAARVGEALGEALEAVAGGNAANELSVDPEPIADGSSMTDEQRKQRDDKQESN